jgi:addiction module HigA family antidote
MSRHRKPGKHKPVHPGEVLMQDFYIPGDLSLYDLTYISGLDRDDLEALLREEASITPQIAEGLAKAFGNSEQFWLGLQAQYDAETDPRS